MKKSLIEKNSFSVLNLAKFLKLLRNFLYHWDLKKRGDLRKSLVLLGVSQLRYVSQWVSRAPEHYTFPAFLNLNGTETAVRLAYFVRDCFCTIFDSYHYKKSAWQWDDFLHMITLRRIFQQFSLFFILTGWTLFINFRITRWSFWSSKTIFNCVPN